MQRFRATCLKCHLNADPLQAAGYYRETGCASCHVLYNSDGLYQGSDPAIPKDIAGYPVRHEFTISIPYTQCNRCHYQGNFDLPTMTFIQRTDLPVPAFFPPKVKRAHEYYQPVGEYAKCEFELDCIDCHTSSEVMGDGILHNNHAEAETIQCLSCHGTLDSVPESFTIEDESDPAILPSRLNLLVDDVLIGDTIMVTERGESRWNVKWDGKQWALIGKATGTHYTIPLVAGSKCAQKPDQQESRYCHECHAYDRDTP